MSYTEAKLPDGDLIAILRREEGEAKCPSCGSDENQLTMRPDSPATDSHDDAYVSWCPCGSIYVNGLTALGRQLQERVPIEVYTFAEGKE